MQYVNSTATNSSNSIVPLPSRSINEKSWSVSGVRSSPNMSKNSTESMVPEPSTSTSSNFFLRYFKSFCRRLSALTACCASMVFRTTLSSMPRICQNLCHIFVRKPLSRFFFWAFNRAFRSSYLRDSAKVFLCGRKVAAAADGAG